MRFISISFITAALLITACSKPAENKEAAANNNTNENKDAAANNNTNENKEAESPAAQVAEAKPFQFTVDLGLFYNQMKCDDEEHCKSYEDLNVPPEIPITISDVPGAKVLYDLDCNGDGTYEFTGLTQSHTCQYDIRDVRFTISIRGEIPGLVLCGDDETEETYGFSDNFGPFSIDQWGSIEWKTMHDFAKNCQSLTLKASDTPDLSHVTDMSSMFEGADKINQPIAHWNVSNVTDMRRLFMGASSFNQILDTWDVSNVTEMQGMFAFARDFNQPLNSWNTSKVRSMASMFNGAGQFNQPIEAWNVSNVNNMSGMFRGAEMFNQPLNSWNTQNVTDMSGMFTRAAAFNQPLNNWNLQKVTSTNAMFMGAKAFDQDLSTWDLNAIADKDNMFVQSGMKTLPHGMKRRMIL